MKRLGLVLSGGGARAAYQAGAIQALGQIMAESGVRCPEILSGVSAGSLNAAYLAAHADQFADATQAITEVWRSVRTRRVFRTDVAAFAAIALGWFRDIASASGGHRRLSRSLLDAAPMAELLPALIAFEKIDQNLRNHYFFALAVSATDYHSIENVTFVQNAAGFQPWQRRRRIGIASRINAAHLMASSAIPLFFSPVGIDGRYYGDGALRNLAPLSAAIHLGADKLIVVGVRKYAPETATGALKVTNPSIARVLSVVTNALLMDNIETDLERLLRINATVALLPENQVAPLKHIDAIYLTPSEDIGAIAAEEAHALPKVLKFLLRGLGRRRESADLVSYLLFEEAYLSRLIELGLHDTLSRKEEICTFLAL